MSVNPLKYWLQTTLFLAQLDVVKRAYSSSYKLIPRDLKEAFCAKDTGYLSDVYHSLDLLLCMLPYRDLQYGPKGGRGAPELRRRMKLAWIAYNIRASQELLNHWGLLERELWEWYEKEGYNYRSEKAFKDFIDFLKGYVQTTVAELAVLYVYLYHDKPIMPLGFMQHLVTSGPSGPTLGDLIDIETLTFVEIKSRRPAGQYKADLISLTVNTRLPSAVAIPRYEVDIKRREVDENYIVAEFYKLAVAGRRAPWIVHWRNLKAPVEEELKPLMQNIAVLRENAEYYLAEKSKNM